MRKLMLSTLAMLSFGGTASASGDLTCYSSDNEWIYCPYNIAVYNPQPQSRSEWIYGDKATCWRWENEWYTCKMLGHSAFIGPISPIAPILPIAPIAPITPIFPLR